MPRKDKTTQDPRTYIELTDGKPLMVAVPKINLGTLADYEGSTTALSQRLGIDRPSLSKWISGQREMPNKQLLYVAVSMDVSPLWLLDLVEISDAHEAPDAMESRTGILADLAAIRELEAGRDVQGYEDIVAEEGGHAGAAERLRSGLRHVAGDYRDLTELALDAVSYYRETPRPDVLLQQVYDATHRYFTHR